MHNCLVRGVRGLVTPWGLVRGVRRGWQDQKAGGGMVHLGINMSILQGYKNAILFSIGGGQALDINN